MGLTSRQKARLFNVFLIAVVLVNAIFIIALAKHYVWGKTVEGIVFINSCFVAELFTAFFLLIKVYFLPSKEDGVSIVTSTKYGSTGVDVDETIKDRGIKYLNLGRASGVPIGKKNHYLNEAKRIFLTVEENSDVYPACLYNLIAVERELGHYEEAKNLINKLNLNFEKYFHNVSDTEKNSRKADLLFSEAFVVEREGDYQSAKEKYEQSWKLDPTDFTAPYNLAVLCYKQGFKEEYNILYKALEKYPDFVGHIQSNLAKDIGANV